jgi:hypothetical protein
MTQPVQKHPHFFTTHYHLLSLKPASSKWSLSLKLSHQNPIRTPSTTHSCQMSRPFHPSWFNRPNNILIAMWIMKPENRTELFTGTSLLGGAFQIRPNSHWNLRTTFFRRLAALLLTLTVSDTDSCIADVWQVLQLHSSIWLLTTAYNIQPSNQAKMAQDPNDWTFMGYDVMWLGI